MMLISNLTSIAIVVLAEYRLDNVSTNFTINSNCGYIIRARIVDQNGNNSGGLSWDANLQVNKVIVKYK